MKIVPHQELTKNSSDAYYEVYNKLGYWFS